MPQPQVHFPGKGREALRQKVLNLSFKVRYGLTVHIIRFYRQNFQFFNSPRIRQNSHILLTFSIMFQVPAPAENPGKLQRITQIPRNLPTQSAN